MIPQERIDKGIQLRGWSQQDDDVRSIIAAVCSTHKVPGYGVLAEQHPEVFDELFDTVKDLLDESPSIGRLPGYMQ